MRQNSAWTYRRKVRSWCQSVKTGKKAQEWEQTTPRPNTLINQYTGNCLDMNSKTDVTTNTCNSAFQAQKWYSPDNGHVGQIQNYYWKKCLKVDGTSLTSVMCNKALIPSERWKMVNVGDTKHLSCDTEKTATSSKAATPVKKTKCAHKPVIPPKSSGACTLKPQGVCLLAVNQCGQSISCACPHGYNYNQATGQCDWGFPCRPSLSPITPKQAGTPSPIKPSKPICTYHPTLCTRDVNECGNPSQCYCEKGYTYNAATWACDLEL